MDVRLKVCIGGTAGQELRLPGPKFFIGRSEDCDLRPKSDLVSRHHCCLMIDEDSVAIRDLGSRNGTFVNDDRIVGEHALENGDHLKVGPLEFEVRIIQVATKRPRVTSIREAAARTAKDSQRTDFEVDNWLGDESEATVPPDTKTRSMEDEKIVDEGSSEDTAETISGEALDTKEISVGQPDPMPTVTNAADETQQASDAADASQTQLMGAATTDTSPGQPTRPAPAPPPEPEAEPAATTRLPTPEELGLIDTSEHTPQQATEPGQRPDFSAPTTADSKEAAADVLRKFFRRR